MATTKQHYSPVPTTAFGVHRGSSPLNSSPNRSNDSNDSLHSWYSQFSPEPVVDGACSSEVIEQIEANVGSLSMDELEGFYTDLHSPRDRSSPDTFPPQ